MNLKHWQERGRFFDHKGLPLFYRQNAASGEVLLFLHGFPTASYDYRKIWSRLSESFSLLAFDMIGYGFSAKPQDFSYTTFEQVDALQALLANLSIRKIHILAHDYGNTVTQELLSREAESRLDFEIETICMLNGALFPETHRPILAQKLLIGPLGFLFGRLIPDGQFKRSLATVFGPKTQPSETELDDYLALFKHNNGKLIAHKLIQYMKERAIYRERWVGALINMKQPFRFINGLEDPVSGKHLVERFREVVSQQKDIIEIDGIGHFPHLECPSRVTESYLQFRS